jgi:hypothetical protein
MIQDHESANEIKAAQEHLEEWKTRIGFNNIGILSSKFQKHVQKTNASHNNDGVSK